MENSDIKKDFGLVVINEKTDLRQQIKEYMKESGYNVDGCDVCSVKCDSIENRDIVLFKLVHYSTPTMSTEPYYRIEFMYELSKKEVLKGILMALRDE